MVSQFCQDIYYFNFGQVGQCFVENVVFGDVTLAGLIIFVLFTALIVRYNFPITMIIPVGIALAYVLMLMTNAPIFTGILLLGMVLGGAVLILGIINYIGGRN